MGGPIPQRHNSISGCPPTPSPPPSPSPPTSLAMPQPMPPLPSYTRYQQNFAAAPIPRGPVGWNGMMRSLDDGDIYRRDAANVVVHHAMNSANYGATGGGTLPRPKGLVKPRPVAKIVANARENVPLASQCDVDPKSMKMNSSFSPLHTPKKMSTIRSDSYEAQVILYIQTASLDICLLDCLSVCLCVCVSVCLPDCLPAFLSVVSLSVCLSTCLPVYLSVVLSVCLSVCLPSCLPVCLPACLPVYLSVFLPVYLSFILAV